MKYRVNIHVRMINELGVEFREGILWLECAMEGCCHVVVESAKAELSRQLLEWPPEAVACIVSAENMKWFVVKRRNNERHVVAHSYFEIR